jgi:hypothetical protein
MELFTDGCTETDQLIRKNGLFTDGCTDGGLADMGKVGTTQTNPDSKCASTAELWRCIYNAVSKASTLRVNE